MECAELSAAVLCPNVGLHLAGCKRVQCALSEQLGRQFIDDHFPNNPNRDLLLLVPVKLQFETSPNIGADYDVPTFSGLDMRQCIPGIKVLRAQ